MYLLGNFTSPVTTWGRLTEWGKVSRVSAVSEELKATASLLSFTFARKTTSSPLYLAASNMCCGYPRRMEFCRHYWHLKDIHKQEREAENKPFAANWSLMPAQEQWNSVREALAHQQSMERSITAMTQVIQTHAAVPASLQDTLHNIHKDMRGVKDFFSGFLSPTLYNEVMFSQDNTIARRVFAVPELLELILVELPIADIMSFQQVDRNAQAAVNGSFSLQRALSLSADGTDRPLRMPFSDFGISGLRGFSCGQYGRLKRAITDNEEMHITANFTNDNGGLPRIGTRWRRMLVVQPPIREMSATVSCCESVRPRTWPRIEPRTITSVSGINIGDLFDAAQELMLEHSQCSNAGTLELDELGLVKVRVAFAATVPLRPGDPILVSRQMKAAVDERKGFESAERNELLHAYVRYRRAGESSSEFKRPAEATDVNTSIGNRRHTSVADGIRLRWAT